MRVASKEAAGEGIVIIIVVVVVVVVVIVLIVSLSMFVAVLVVAGVMIVRLARLLYGVVRECIVHACVVFSLVRLSGASAGCGRSIGVGRGV
jgi:hypothetical protein